jgi:hypothetical protein
MERPTIKFTENYNQKLLCPYFTTVRKHDPEIYEKGRSYVIEFRQFGFLAQCLDLKTITPKAFNDFLCYLDAGMSPTRFHEFMTQVYGAIEGQQFDFLLLHRTGPVMSRTGGPSYLQFQDDCL